MVRAFLAIDLPLELKKKLSEVKKVELPERIRGKWVETENFHLTLHFFGNLEEKVLEKVSKKLEEFFKEFSAFSLELTEIGTFPEKGIPRVIWMGLKDPSLMLERIHEELVEVLKKLKLYEKRDPFHPHITLLRIKGIEGREEFEKFFEGLRREGQKLKGEKFPVREIILFKSELTSKGPIYTPLKKFYLKGVAP